MMMKSALVGFVQCYLTETTVCRQKCRSTRTHYPDFESTRLCSFSLMLRFQQRSNKYQFYSLEPTIYPIQREHANIYTTDTVSVHVFNDFSFILFKKDVSVLIPTFRTHVLLLKHLSKISALSHSVFPSLTMSTCKRIQSNLLQ